LSGELWARSFYQEPGSGSQERQHWL